VENYTPDFRAAFASPEQRSEQYFTASQFFAHFLRQTIGLPQWAQGLEGRFSLSGFGVMGSR
jgi:hypothetical protein